MRNRLTVMLMIISLAITANAKSVHWISIFNTADPHIGMLNTNGEEKLYENIIAPAAYLYDSLGYDNYLYKISGENFRTENIVSTIGGLITTPEDMVFLYYAGHGTGTSDSYNSPFPVLTINNTTSDRIDFNYIKNELESKDCKGLVITAVCSNEETDHPMASREGLDSLKTAGKSEVAVKPISLNKETFGELKMTEAETGFFSNIIKNLDKEYLICAARRGDQALGSPTPLGDMDIFTCALILTIKNAASTGESTNFEEILNSVCQTVGAATEQQQRPFYQINHRNITK